MAESKQEQIIAGLVTLFDAIASDAGTTYWYTPNVTRLPGIQPNILKPGKASGSESILAIIPVDTRGNEESTHEVTKTTQVDLALLKLWAPSAEVPFNTPSPDRMKLQHRLLQDAEKAVLADVRLGGLVDNLYMDWFVDQTAENTYVPGWAVAFVRMTILYHHDKASP